MCGRQSYYVNNKPSGYPWAHAPFGDTQPVAAKNFAYNLRFPGQVFDAETGLSYNMARDYNSALGRYAQSDPLGLAAGVNTYGYVGNNPLWASDSDGRFWWIVVPVAIGTVAIIHWTRNHWNQPPVTFNEATASWTRLPPNESIYHTQGQGNEGNLKFISRDGGHSEAVFTSAGCPVTDSTNGPSYNFADPNLLGGVPHGIVDVLPYMVFGNTPSDMFTGDRFRTTWGKVIAPKLDMNLQLSPVAAQ